MSNVNQRTTYGFLGSGILAGYRLRFISRHENTHQRVNLVLYFARFITFHEGEINVGEDGPWTDTKRCQPFVKFGIPVWAHGEQ